MIREKISVENKLGLHTRAAAKLVAVASQFSSNVELQRNDEIANCKSIMAIIVLGITQGTMLELIISGADELEARDAIVELVKGHFGETQ